MTWQLPREPPSNPLAQRREAKWRGLGQSPKIKIALTDYFALKAKFNELELHYYRKRFCPFPVEPIQMFSMPMGFLPMGALLPEAFKLLNNA